MHGDKSQITWGYCLHRKVFKGGGKKQNKSARIYTPVKKLGSGARGVRGARGKQEQIVTIGHTIKKKIPRGET